MKKIFMMGILLLFFRPVGARADLFGGDLPLLAQIVANTLSTLYEMQRQTSLLRSEMEGIRDKIERVRTISELVQPSSWEEWKNPEEALRRLRQIYYTVPKEYRTEKGDEIERELTRAMEAISHISQDAKWVFRSGKELERRGADSSPGVAQKLTASGVGTLITLEAQSQVLQSHITSLLAKMLADATEKETRSLVSKGQGYGGVARSLQSGSFSRTALFNWGAR